MAELMSKTETKASPSNQRAILTLLVIACLDAVGFNLILPLLPFIALEMGASATVVGLLAMTYAAAALASAPVFGVLTDRMAPRRVLTWSLVGTLVSYVGLSLSTGLISLFLFRALGGLMAGRVVLVQAELARSAEPQRRAKVLGWFGAAVGAGAIIGPLLGGGALWLMPERGLTFACAISAAFSATTILFVVVSIPTRSSRQLGRSQKGEKANGSDNIKHLGLLGVVLLTLGLSYAINSVLSMTALYSEAIWDWSAGDVGILLSFTAIIYLVVQLSLIKGLAQLLGDAFAALAGAAILGVAVIALSLPLLPWQGFLAYATFTIGMAVSTTFSRTLAAKYGPPNKQGVAFGQYQFAFGVAQLVAPITTGMLFERWGPRAAFLCGAIVLSGFIVCACIIFLMSHHRSSAKA